MTGLLQEKENHVYKNYNLVAHYTRELYTAFKQEGNWKEARVYYEQYTAAQDSQKVMTNGPERSYADHFISGRNYCPH